MTLIFWPFLNLSKDYLLLDNYLKVFSFLENMRKQGTVIKRRYYPTKFGERDWWLVLTLRDKLSRFTITGASNYIPSEGDYAIAWGDYDSKNEFKATKLTFTEPQELPYIINRLRSFNLFEENEIHQLTQQYGKKIWTKIERGEIECKNPDELKNQFDLWKHRSDKEEAEIEILKYFEKMELPIKDDEARLIVAALGCGAKARFLSDPLCLYQLLDAKFLKEYAKKLKLAEKSELLFLACFYETVKAGKDLCLPIDNFAEKQKELLPGLLEKGYIEKYQDYYYLSPPYESFNTEEEEEDVKFCVGPLTVERKTAQVIAYLLQNPEEIIYPGYNEIATELMLSDEQTAALEMFMKNRISLVYGGPGNGKTKMIAAIVALAYATGATFNLLAPTGRAAKRIRELMNEESYTIHRFLLGGNITRGQFLIIDECSMIDSRLLYRLFSSGGFERVLMLGDTNQLPPISAGFPFLQMRLCEEIPRVILTKNFRFDADSVGIGVALKRIISGNPNLKNCGKGLTIINTNKIRAHLYPILDAYEDFNVEEFRIITPLNRVVKSFMEDIRSHYLTSDDEIAVGDWIICRKNSPTKNIYNGDIGCIKSIREVLVEKEVKKDGQIETVEKMEIHYFVDFDGVEIELEDRSFFNLAYITTVHSSQGGETDNVIFIMESDSRINNRQLLYTALSRAKKGVHIIAPKSVISEMILRIEETRYSCLALLIKDELNKK